MRDAARALDHLVFAVPRLAEGIALLEARTGVRAAPGGRHPRWGTHNALLSLGPGAYLELIAPDPDRPAGVMPAIFGLSTLVTPRLATWAIRSPAIEPDREAAAAAGVTPGAVLAGARERADGTVLSWRLTDPATVTDDGLVPFLIDWGDSPHPSADAPLLGPLSALRALHPEPERVRAHCAALGVTLDVRPGSPTLIAVIDTPRGPLELR